MRRRLIAALALRVQVERNAKLLEGAGFKPQ
jgi:hypothetical protein